ncbi:TolC family protein [Marinoscillum furvescens]|uniref:Outer membrane protein TolC n=1 Tax=Marinoscillum furvescens DSM 4134 TaxID=1122208 RepID=A0A3D9L358_MARFU|nr:TolC family protein [Marinoscillum furvescens]RED99536.1 outer membrane protein TolC [Marinoscillum furvescens DSM 4134]
MKKLVGILFLLIVNVATAQTDTVYLALEEVLEMARSNHPLLAQARLQSDLADAQLRTARGTLDPKIESSYQLKNFKDKTYYDKFYNALKIPVWFPIDPKVEVYRNEGSYLNPESYVSSATDHWQVTAGVSLPVGKGLFIDERRMLIKQAKIYGSLAEAEQIKLANKALFTIIKSYWDWYLASEKLKLAISAQELAADIYDRVLTDYEYGEAAVVDTVQALITFQTRQADYTKAQLDWNQTRLALSIHLWGAEGIPLELSELAFPVPNQTFGVVPSDTSVQRLVSWATENHPEVIKLAGKSRQLDVEQSWNKESLKPEINLSYSLIDAPFSQDGISTPKWDENYKLGMDFSFPLLLRKERGKLQKTRVYKEQVELDLQLTRKAVENQILAEYNELLTLQTLRTQYQLMSQNYQRLYQAEIINLENGESDLFKLNIQQNKLLEANIKYLEAYVKFEKQKVQLPYTAGLPDLSYLQVYE